MLTCFGDGVSAQKLDREPFKFRHNLMGHPALELGNLARVIPTLSKDQVMYSVRQLQNGDDFESTFRQRPEHQTIEETIENIRVSDSYIMVSYSTFLMQFRGSKQVTVSQPWDDRVVSVKDCENYVAYVNTRLPWAPDKDAYAMAFDFAPGEALHIPFVSGHHVRNGGGDVSISMSIIFNTPQTMAWRSALNFNQRARKVLRHVGLSPAPVGNRPFSDSAKARFWSLWARLRYP